MEYLHSMMAASTDTKNTASDVLNVQVMQLTGWVTEGTALNVYLRNGVRLMGQLVGFDAYTLFLQGFIHAQCQVQSIAKHQVLSIIPYVLTAHERQALMSALCS